MGDVHRSFRTVTQQEVASPDAGEVTSGCEIPYSLVFLSLLCLSCRYSDQTQLVTVDKELQVSACDSTVWEGTDLCHALRLVHHVI